MTLVPGRFRKGHMEAKFLSGASGGRVFYPYTTELTYTTDGTPNICQLIFESHPTLSEEDRENADIMDEVLIYWVSEEKYSNSTDMFVGYAVKPVKKQVCGETLNWQFSCTFESPIGYLKRLPMLSGTPERGTPFFDWQFERNQADGDHDGFLTVTEIVDKLNQIIGEQRRNCLSNQKHVRYVFLDYDTQAEIGAIEPFGEGMEIRGFPYPEVTNVYEALMQLRDRMYLEVVDESIEAQADAVGDITIRIPAYNKHSVNTITKDELLGITIYEDLEYYYTWQRVQGCVFRANSTPCESFNYPIVATDINVYGYHPAPPAELRWSLVASDCERYGKNLINWYRYQAVKAVIHTAFNPHIRQGRRYEIEGTGKSYYATKVMHKVTRGETPTTQIEVSFELEDGDYIPEVTDALMDAARDNLDQGLA